MRILIFRLGAFGDVLVTTPVIRYLASQGHELIYVANERGVQVLKNNPHIKLLIEQKTDEVKTENLPEHIDYLKRKHRCERVIDFSESIEVALSQHPRSPNYKLPKAERIARFNRNFYEYAFEHMANHVYPEIDEAWMERRAEHIYGGPQPNSFFRPELFFDKSEIDEAKKYLKDGYFNILIGMSGSGTNKTWPHTEELCTRIANEIPEAHMITVGDYRSTLIEPVIPDRITNISGKIPMRISMALTSLCDLVISPDTGLLHAAGCYKTPKIGILGHNTIECITKHFENDYSVESDPSKAECSPCLFLIYNKNLQCPTVERFGGASLCMAEGIPTNTVFDKVKSVYLSSKG